MNIAEKLNEINIKNAGGEGPVLLAQAPRVSVLGSVPNPIDPSSDAGFVRVRSEARAELISK